MLAEVSVNTATVGRRLRSTVRRASNWQSMSRIRANPASRTTASSSRVGHVATVCGRKLRAAIARPSAASSTIAQSGRAALARHAQSLTRAIEPAESIPKSQ